MKPAEIRKGREAWEYYYSEVLRTACLEYNFRAEDGALFTTIVRVRDGRGDALALARSQRDTWAASRKPARAPAALPERY